MVKTEAPAYAKAAGNSYSLHLPLARLSSTLHTDPAVSSHPTPVHRIFTRLPTDALTSVGGLPLESFRCLRLWTKLMCSADGD